MYAEFFGLRELPFNNTPDPRFFYSTPDHEEALASLVYAVKERKGFVLLTGEVGAGKTLVTRLMLRRFGGSVAFANINHAIQDSTDLIESVCTEFELPVEPSMSHSQMVRLLHDYLLARFAANVPVVLVLDEGQNLPTEAFEELRMIGNLEADAAKLLQIAIVGQPELQEKFQSPALRQLKQRLFRSFHLPALNRKQTEGYIHYRLCVAGAARNEIFTAHAIDRIHELSRGLPRIINTLCDNAMLSAYSSDHRIIDAPLIDSVSDQTVAGDARLAGTAKPKSAVAKATTKVMPQRLGNVERAQTTAGIATSVQPVASVSISHVPDSRATQALKTHESCDSRKEDTDQFLQQLASAVEKIVGRISKLEERATQADPMSAQAEIIHAGLHALVDQATNLFDRTQASNRELAKREQTVRQLLADLRTSATALHPLLTRLLQASGEARRDIHAAHEAHAQLIEANEQTLRTAGRMTQLRQRAGEQSQLAARPVQDFDVRAVGVLCESVAVSEMEQLQAGTQASLAELRRMSQSHAVPEPDKAHSSPSNGSASWRKARLHDQVSDPAPMFLPAPVRSS